MPTSTNVVSKQVAASSSGLSNSSSKTLLADNQEQISKSTTVSGKHHLKRSLDHLEQSHTTVGHPLNKNLKQQHIRHHYCANKNVQHCLMHSQSSHCLNEHHPVCHHLTTVADESSSSSSQSTRSTEELNRWSSTKHHYQFAPCPSLKHQFNAGHLNSHLSNSLHLHPGYLNASSSECSTDDSYSADSPMLMHLHHKNCLHHHHSSFNSNLNNPTSNDDLICACCEHRTHRIKSGVIPSTYLYEFEQPGKQSSHYAGSSTNYSNQDISNLYDYHSTQLEDMFNSGKCSGGLIIHFCLFLFYFFYFFLLFLL